MKQRRHLRFERGPRRSDLPFRHFCAPVSAPVPPRRGRQGNTVGPFCQAGNRECRACQNNNDGPHEHDHKQISQKRSAFRVSISGRGARFQQQPEPPANGPKIRGDSRAGGADNAAVEKFEIVVECLPVQMQKRTPRRKGRAGDAHAQPVGDCLQPQLVASFVVVTCDDCRPALSAARYPPAGGCLRPDRQSGDRPHSAS